MIVEVVVDTVVWVVLVVVGPTNGAVEVVVVSVGSVFMVVVVTV